MTDNKCDIVKTVIMDDDLSGIANVPNRLGGVSVRDLPTTTISEVLAGGREQCCPECGAGIDGGTIRVGKYWPWAECPTCAKRATEAMREAGAKARREFERRRLEQLELRR